MRTSTFILAGLTSLALGAGSALAGQCTMEIRQLSQELGELDPEPGASTPATAQPPAASERSPAEGEIGANAGGDPGTALLSEAGIALNRAHKFDLEGREAECMEAVGRAKELSGK